MDQATNNPSTNNLGSGISDEEIATAVKKSGYPLQILVANFLRNDFGVQEEWSYIDKDTKELRTIDILAGRYLYDLTQQPRVRPHLNLLVECKQSSLPYIFLLSSSKPRLPEFPEIAGLSTKNLTITTDGDPSSWTFSILSSLGLDIHPFITTPIYSTTLSKCVRKGSELELSGSESYNSLILPLIKSIQHFKVTQEPPKTAVYFDSHLVIGIGILDAPMIGVEVTQESNLLRLIPWVRVLRHESIEADHWTERSKLWAVDIVHKDFFENYISQHLFPYANVFASLVLKHQEVIANGKGFISGMGRSSWDRIEARLQSKTAKAQISRINALCRNIFRALTGKKLSDE